MNFDDNENRIISEMLKDHAKVPLFQIIFNVADKYNQLSDKCYSEINAKNDAGFAAPAMVNNFFSIELLLKFFISLDFKDDETPENKQSNMTSLKGHSFSKLFDKIDVSRKNSIALKHSERTGLPATVKNIRDILTSFGNDPFVNWRYFYEDEGVKFVNVQILRFITDTLGLAAQDALRNALAKAKA